MYALANARCTILGGTTENLFGDELDAANELGTVLARIDERTKTVRDPNTHEPRIVRAYTAIVPGNCQITDEHRLRDDTRGGQVYAIRSVSQNLSNAFTPDKVLELALIN